MREHIRDTYRKLAFRALHATGYNGPLRYRIQSSASGCVGGRPVVYVETALGRDPNGLPVPMLPEKARIVQNKTEQKERTANADNRPKRKRRR